MVAKSDPRSGGMTSAAQPRRSRRLSVRFGSLFVVLLLAALMISVSSPTSAGEAGVSIRAEAASSNYVNVDGVPLGTDVTVTFENNGTKACADYELTGGVHAGNPMDNDPACDIEPGWTLRALVPGQATPVAELVVAHAEITGFSSTSVFVDTTDPGVADPTQIVDYSCSGGVFVHSASGASRVITSPGPVEIDFTAGGGDCPGFDVGSYDVSTGGEFILNMQVNDGEANPDTTVDVKTNMYGYWMLGADGRIYQFGDVAAHGGVDLEDGATAVAFDRLSSGEGIWVLDSSGQVRAVGAAVNFGNVDLASLAPGDRVASISGTPSGNGYWVFTDLGRAITFGDAAHYDDLPGLGIVPNGPVVASASTPSGKGYYMLGADGGVFAFGDAQFFGSIPAVLPPGSLQCPIVGLVPVPTGDGYWMVACDGCVFAFGNAPFRGSTPGVLPPGVALNSPINGLVPYGNGYLMVAADGGVFTFSDLAFLGSLGDSPPAAPIVAITAWTTSG